MTATILLVGDVPASIDPLLSDRHRVERVALSSAPRADADFVLVHEPAGALSEQVEDWLEVLRDEQKPFGYATPRVDRDRQIRRVLRYVTPCNLEGDQPSAAHLREVLDEIGIQLAQPVSHPGDIALGRYFQPHQDYEEARTLSLVSPKTKSLVRELSLAIAMMARHPIPEIPWDPTERVASLLVQGTDGGPVQLKAAGRPRLSDLFAAGDTNRARQLMRADDIVAARSDYPKPNMAMIRGESGSGKTLVAELMWLAFADAAGWVRPDRPMPFVKINCGGMTVENFDHLMLGTGRDRYTGVSANVGYLPQADYGVAFLDELGDMHPSAQSRFKALLDDLVIQPTGLRPYYLHLRVVAATNAALERSGFQNDLLRRFTITLHVPSLNERGDEELLRLVDFVAQNPAANPPDGPHRFTVGHISEGACRALVRHDWTEGNFRELRQVVEQAIGEAIKRRRRVVEEDDVRRSFMEKAAPPADARVVRLAGELEDLRDSVDVAGRADLLRASVLHSAPILRTPSGWEYVRVGPLAYRLAPAGSDPAEGEPGRVESGQR